MKEKPHFDGFDGNDKPIINTLYQDYASRADYPNDTLRECFSVLEESTKDMPFELRNRICTAVVTACAESERLAFLDGIPVGAKLVWELFG